MRYNSRLTTIKDAVQINQNAKFNRRVQVFKNPERDYVYNILGSSQHYRPTQICIELKKLRTSCRYASTNMLKHTHYVPIC